MDYIAPQYTREEVDAAGKALAKRPSEDFDMWAHAYAIADNWRAAHQYPLNSISVVLKTRARKISPHADVFQRVKRFPSILYKLRKRAWISLAEMQDLGGCRAVLPTVADVHRLREVYRTSDISHKLVKENDYLKSPKGDGYRGIHLIYSYRGASARGRVYAQRQMKVEIQLRSLVQHYWATAVETAETFTRQAMKSRPKTGGLSGWEEFFALVSGCFAAEEGEPQVPGLPPTMAAIVERLRELEAREHYTNLLETFKVTAEEISTRNKAKYFLLDLDPEAKRLRIRGFKPDEMSKANAALISKEQETLFAETNTQQVLVSLDGIAQLKRAYPNYYLDTTQFVNKVRAIISGESLQGEQSLRLPS